MKTLLTVVFAVLVSVPATAANDEKGFTPCATKVTDNAYCDFGARGRISRW